MPGDPSIVPLCRSTDLHERGAAVGFDVRFAGLTCTAFAVRHDGRALSYLNRCSHMAMTLDGASGRVYDKSGRWLLCHVHGAVFDPPTGACVGGPCRGGLVPIQLSEFDGVVHWHTAYNLKPAEF